MDENYLISGLSRRLNFRSFEPDSGLFLRPDGQISQQGRQKSHAGNAAPFGRKKGELRLHQDLA